MSQTADPVSALADLTLRGARPTTPWTADHLVRLLAQNLVGLITVCMGAYAASRSDDPQQSVFWVNIAIAGLIVAGGANGAWLMRVRRTVSQGRDVSLVFAREVLLVNQPIAGPDSSIDEGGRVSAPGTVRFHRPECEFVRHRPVDDVGPDEIERRVLMPCEVCQP